METVYSKRRAELQQKTVDDNQKQVSAVFGLQRPLSKTAPSVPQKPEGPDESYKDTDFYRNIDFHQNDDPHFKQMMGSYTELVMGLKHQVDQGYMPLPVAQRRMMSYLQDSANHRESVNPMVQSQNDEAMKQQAANSQLGMVMQQMQQGGQAPQEGVNPSDVQPQPNEEVQNG